MNMHAQPMFGIVPGPFHAAIMWLEHIAEREPEAVITFLRAQRDMQSLFTIETDYGQGLKVIEASDVLLDFLVKAGVRQ